MHERDGPVAEFLTIPEIGAKGDEDCLRSHIGIPGPPLGKPSLSSATSIGSSGTPLFIGKESSIAYQPVFCNRSTASVRRSLLVVTVMRIYPSPGSPNPLPGVVTIPAFSIRCA